ncbi:MAG: GNAT family N-acetyltransferase [Chloroflexota bacterium]|nr:GNAT family N-acetyltransferase [Chloroflexota bacterium]
MMTPALVALPDTLVITYLHMTEREQFRPAYLPPSPDVVIMQAVAPDMDYYRFIYKAVGYALRWRDRLIMPDEELSGALHSPDTSVHVLFVRGVPAGYVELAKQGSDTEVAYFGLRPQYQGQGLGKHLLSYGIQRAWDDGAARVWVHTCNMDGEHALENYLKRGFVVYDVQEEPMPERYRV